MILSSLRGSAKCDVAATDMCCKKLKEERKLSWKLRLETLKYHLISSSPRCSVSKENESRVRAVCSALPLCDMPGCNQGDLRAVTKSLNNPKDI